MLIKATLLTMFYTNLRVGEAVQNIQNQHVIKANQVTYVAHQNCFHICILSYKFSKQNRPVKVILKPLHSEGPCPVEALKEYLGIRRGPRKSPLFIKEDGTVLDRRYLAAALKSLIALTGRNPAQFNTHSLRVGRTSEMALNGLSTSMIKSVGRWNSNAFEKYIRPKEILLPQ